MPGAQWDCTMHTIAGQSSPGTPHVPRGARNCHPAASLLSRSITGRNSVSLVLSPPLLAS